MGLQPTRLKRINWDEQIGRRLRLRDLHVFSTVVQLGSMSKAAHQLGVSQPAISEVIANLEQALTVRLFDRLPHGVEPTVYGRALARRSIAALDELRLGVRDIASLADPTSGEVRIGCTEPMTAVLLPILEKYTAEHPGLLFHIDSVDPGTLDLQRLHDRRFDFVLGLSPLRSRDGDWDGDVNVEVLFDEKLVVAVGAGSRWSRRRSIDLAELRDERWILAGPDSWNYRIVSEAFLARGLGMPQVSMMTFSVFLRTNMVASGNFIATFPSALARFNADRLALKILPVDLRSPPWPLVIVTLKRRTLSPVVERFIQEIREFTRPMRRSMKAR